MLSTKLKEAAGNSADATLYVDDVFSTYLYTGNGAAQTITNGIDLAGKGGLVWVKTRSTGTTHHMLTHIPNYYLASDSINGISGPSTSYVNSFNSNGFTGGLNTQSSGTTYASWTFRKAAKFFDVVTYTGNGVNGRAIPHNLGIAPGMIIVKSTSNSSDWITWHKSLSVPTNSALYLNGTQAELTGAYFPTLPTSSVFYTNGSGYDVNTIGQTYVAYLFAHDTSSTGIIQCGSFTTDGSGNFTPVNLGWETQYILYKKTNAVGDWNVGDVMRGMAVTNDPASPPPSGSSQVLYPNSSVAEANGIYISPTATGFSSSYSGALSASSTYIYMAIRMPNKPPTSGTQVYNGIARTGTGSASLNVTGVGFAPDVILPQFRTITDTRNLYSKLIGVYSYIRTTGSNAQFTYTSSGVASFNMDGYTQGVSDAGNYNASGYTFIDWFFKRAPGFMDVVCYTGTGSATTQAHNLTVVPELMIVKERSVANNWWVYVSSVGNTKYSVLNSTAIPVTSSTAWNNTTPTASVFSIGTGANVNASAQTFVAYLFATLAGISKVGSYTGNGTGQAIACGFSAGARFVLIKRTDSTGDWYTFDSARGLTSGSSPYLLLNSTAAEVTGNNGVYASTGGFTLGSTASTTTNISGASYIYLSVA